MTVAAFERAKPTEMEKVISELAEGVGGKMGLGRKRLGESALSDILVSWVT